MNFNRKARIVIATIGVVLGLALLVPACRHGYDATLTLADLAHLDTPLPDHRPDVLLEEMSYHAGGRELAADLYVPGSVARAGLVLVPGAAAEGRADARLVEFATILARSGFAVLVPDIPSFRELRPSPESADQIGAAFALLSVRAELTAGARLGIGAFSLATGPAVVAALDPAIAGRVRFLFLVGGYYDLARTLGYMTTGYFEADGRQQYRQPNEYGKWVYALSNASRLQEPVERQALALLANRKLEDPGAEVNDLLAQLGSAGMAVYDFISNTDPARVPGLIGDLPPAVRSDIDALNLEARNLSGLDARVILVHGLDDDIIPYTESVALAAALAPGQAKLHLLEGLHHVDREFGGLDTWRMWRAMQLLLAQRDA